MSKELSKKLEGFLQSIFKKRESEPFREPVDYEGLGLTDYTQIIKKMMDLGTIRKNIRAESYKYLEDALDDIQLVWDNCKLYNIEESFIHKTAVKLEKATEALVKDQLLDLSKNSNAKKPGQANPATTEKQEECIKKAFL